MNKCLLFIFIFMCSFFNITKAKDMFAAFDDFNKADQTDKNDQNNLANKESLMADFSNFKNFAYRQFKDAHVTKTIKNHVKRVVNGVTIYEEKDGVVLIDKTKKTSSPSLSNKKVIISRKISNQTPKNKLSNISKQTSTSTSSSNSSYKKKPSLMHTYKPKVSMKIVKEDQIPEFVGFNKYNQDIGQDKEITKSVEDINKEILVLKKQKRESQKIYLSFREKFASIDTEIDNLMQKMVDNKQKIKSMTDQKRKERLQRLEDNYKTELQGYKDEKQKIEDQKLELKNKIYNIDDKVGGLEKILKEIERSNRNSQKKQKQDDEKLNMQLKKEREDKAKEIQKQAEDLAKSREQAKKQKELELKLKKEAEAKLKQQKLDQMLKEKEQREQKLKQERQRQQEIDQKKKDEEQRKKIEAQKLEIKKQEQKRNEEFLKQKQLRDQRLKEANDQRNKVDANKKVIVYGSGEDIDKDKYRPIKIVYDSRFMKDMLYPIAASKKIGKKNQTVNQVIEEYTKKIKILIQHCDQIFKKYLWLPKDTQQEILVPKGFDGCQASNGSDGSFNYEGSNFTQALKYNADLVIYFTAYYGEKMQVKNKQNQIVLAPNTVNASALPCKISVFEQPDGRGFKRTVVGRINFNIFNINLDTEDVYKYSQYVNTSVHELFHVVAFHQIIFKDFNKFVDKKNYPHLYSLKEYTDKTKSYTMEESHAHWKEQVIPVDVMIPTSTRFKGLSIYSLEYIDLANKLMVTNKSSLPENFYTKHLNFRENFLDYKCEDNQSSKNPYFCSALDLTEDPFGCSADYKMKVVCSELGRGNGRYDNNCYPKSTFAGNDKEESNSYCTNVNGVVDNQNIAEVFSKNSRCFNQLPMYGSICLEFDIEGNDLYIKMQDQRAKCTKENEVVELKFFIPGQNGTYRPHSVKCPPIKEFINSFKRTSCSNECYFNGFCIDGQCDCFEGWDPAQDCRTHKPNSPGAFSTFIK